MRIQILPRYSQRRRTCCTRSNGECNVDAAMSKPHNRDPYRPTPGPWHVSCGSVYGPEGQPIADMDREPGNGTYPTERDRNAQLIAAAPAMRDALRWMRACEDNRREWNGEDFRSFART